MYELLWSLGHKLGEHLVRSLVWYIKRDDNMLQQKIRLEILLKIHGSVKTEESYIVTLVLGPYMLWMHLSGLHNFWFLYVKTQYD